MTNTVIMLVSAKVDSLCLREFLSRSIFKRNEYGDTSYHMLQPELKLSVFYLLHK